MTDVDQNELSNASDSTSDITATTTITPLREAPVPSVKKVTITISHHDYLINCPADEEEELHAAVSYINSFIADIKRDAPHLNQENLLVLCCLNLYEKIHAQQQSNNDQRQMSKEADTLLSKILKDAQSLLKQP